jgi:hypothetical protein
MTVKQADEQKRQVVPSSRAGKRQAPSPVIVLRRRYTGQTGASVGDIPERAAFDRGSRVTK